MRRSLISPEERWQTLLVAAPEFQSDRRRLLLGFAGLFVSMQALGSGGPAVAALEPFAAAPASRRSSRRPVAGGCPPARRGHQER